MSVLRLSGKPVAAALAVLLAAALLGWWGFARRAHAQTPQFSAISTDLSQGWIPFGGAWRSGPQSIIGDSEDRGPKLMNGSPDWKNYFVEADVRLLGIYGDAGIIVRSTGEEEGVDSYHGYFAGVRNMDNSFLLGRADYGWNLFIAKSVPNFAGWYHLKLLAYQCSIAAEITNAAGLKEISYANDPHCLTQGRFGFKSYETSAEWKNVRIGPAAQADLLRFTEGLAPVTVNYDSHVPESDYSTSALDQYIDPLRREAEEHKFQLRTQPIGTLGLIHSADSGQATIRGIVTIAHPVLYVQDPTGTILIKTDSSIGPVRVGDEVEAQGVLSNDDLSPVLDHATVQLLWPNSQILPIVVTPFELASGRNSGRFVETDGILLSQSAAPNRSLALRIENDSQEFYAIVSNDDATTSAAHLQPGSRLRLRGVASSDPAFTNNLVPFAILVPSPANIQVIGPPPRWTPMHIALVTGILLLLAGALHLLLSHIQRWRHEAILRERERIALEIHDTLAQSFAGIAFQLQAMRSDAVANRPIREQLEIALNMVRRSHKEAKQSIKSIEPAIDNGPSIAESLRQVAEQLNAGQSLAIHSTSQGPARRIPQAVAETIFRIGQEAIFNSARHSGATTLDINLDVQRNTAQLVIKDNGTGFIVDTDHYGFGLRGMSRRAASVAAHLEVSSSPQTGTTVVLSAPIGQISVLSQRSIRWFRQFSDPEADTNGKFNNSDQHSHIDR
jgi:signal transduction histidine kinase